MKNQREIKFRSLNCHKFWYYWNIKDEMDLSLVDKSTISQFTGLKDKNGKEIYGGDIVRLHNEKEHTLVVEFGSHKDNYNSQILSAFRLVYKDTKNYCENARVWTEKDIEIIGNIYENPNLNKNYPNWKNLK